MFCLGFCFIAWRCSPESRLKNILLFLGKCSGANSWFLVSVLCRHSLVMFCLGFLLHCIALFPREPSEKIILFLGPRFGCELLVFGFCALSIFFGDVRWRVPNPPGANPLVAERAPWRSSQSCVTGGQQSIGNPYRFLSFLLHSRQPLCDP